MVGRGDQAVLRRLVWGRPLDRVDQQDHSLQDELTRDSPAASKLFLVRLRPTIIFSQDPKLWAHSTLAVGTAPSPSPPSIIDQSRMSKF